MNVNLFRERLAAQRLSQRQLAQALDVNPMTISAIATGKSDPKISLGVRIASVLGVSSDALFPIDAEAPQSPPPARKLRSIKGGAPARPPKREAPTSAADAGRAGGLARAKALTPEQLSEQAKHANRVRWSRAAKANAMCGRHHPALRLIRGGIRSGTDAERKAA